MQKNCQNGRSMVEMLGVLAIVAVLSVGGIAGYSKAMAKHKIGKALNQVQTLVTDIRSLYSSTPDYRGINTAQLIQLEVIPNDMRVDANNAKNVFGAPVLVGPWHGPIPASYQGFELIYNGLDKTSCIQLATADWGSSASGMAGMDIGGIPHLFTVPNLILTHHPPISMNTADNFCSSNGTSNTITWVFR